MTYLVATKVKRSSKWELPEDQWPRIKCIWCNYEDPLPRDLSYHMIEEHRKNLFEDILGIKYRVSKYRYLYEAEQMEIASDKAVEQAKIRSGVLEK
ncbi:hypothetical protein BH18THE1_BH18THE1_03420 [soil metagenome]